MAPLRHRRIPRSPVLIAIVVGVAVLAALGAVVVWGRPGAGAAHPAALTRTAGSPPPTGSTGSTPSAVPPGGAASSPAPGPATPAPTTSTTSTRKPVVAPPPRPPAGNSPKKGVSVWDFSGLGAALADVHAAWYYNWAAGPSGGAGTSTPFVPMIWGGASVNAGNLAKAKASGSTLLGFNEPDMSGQANMSVTQALDLWPQLQATGLRLGSPAVAYGGDRVGGWLDQFMAGAKTRGYRVDFITLHWYGSDFSGAAVGQLQGYIQAVYSRYHLPIWLTEYALIRFGSPSTYPTSDQQVAFIRGSTAMLQSLSYLERYAWFALPTSSDGDHTGLYRDGSTPTASGVAYRAVTG